MSQWEPKDILCIGDSTTDAFIALHEASVLCDLDQEHCKICLSFADKIPYEDLVVVPGVGNAANVSVGTARLGHRARLLSAVGDDANGKEILAVLRGEKVNTDAVAVNKGAESNYHFVLTFRGERTILIKHHRFSYTDLATIERSEWMFFTSLGEGTEVVHDAVAAFVQHGGIKMGFNPGTFQIKMGKERLAAVYHNAFALFLNRAEAQEVLGVSESDVRRLLNGLHALGPTIVCITDGPAGAYISDGDDAFRMPAYPDPKPPKERTGAGDSFAAAFMAALMYGLMPREAATWAPINSMSVVQYVGAREGLLTKEQLLQYLENAPQDYKPASLS